MNQFAPASSLDKQRHSSLSMSPEAPLEQDFHTPDGSPVRPFRPTTARKLTLSFSCLHTIPLLSCFWSSDHPVDIEHPPRLDTR